MSDGNSGKIRIPKIYDKVLVIPEVSTYEQQGIVYAYQVVKDNKVQNIILKVVDRIDNRVIVSEGLKKGDEVVALGVSSLKPDTQIKPKMIDADSLVQSLKPVF